MPRIAFRRPWNAPKNRPLDARPPERCELRQDTTGEYVCRLCHVRIEGADEGGFSCPRGRSGRNTH